MEDAKTKYLTKEEMEGNSREDARTQEMGKWKRTKGTNKGKRGNHILGNSS